MTLEEPEHDHRHFEEAAPIYATGGLEPSEREAFEAHLESGCAVCFDLLKELQPTKQFEPDDPVVVHSETLSKIPEHDIPSDNPPISSRGKRVRDSQTGRGFTVRSILTSGVLALVLVVVAAGSLWYALSGRTDISHLVEERHRLELDLKELNQRMEKFQDQVKVQSEIVSEIRAMQERHPDVGVQTNGLSTRVKALTAQLADREKENASLVREVTAMTEYEAFVQSSRLQVVAFVGKRSLDAKAFFFYDPETSNALFYGVGLPPLPPNAVYQMWALVKKPISLGTFKLGDGNNGRLWLQDILKLAPGTKFAVSIERGTGAPKPTGAIQLLGELPKNG